MFTHARCRPEPGRLWQHDPIRFGSDSLSTFRARLIRRRLRPLCSTNAPCVRTRSPGRTRLGTPRPSRLGCRPIVIGSKRRVTDACRFCVFDGRGEDRLAGVEEERLEGITLILRAIDVTIADVEARNDADGREQLATLRYMRERWRRKAEVEARLLADAGRFGDGESRG